MGDEATTSPPSPAPSRRPISPPTRRLVAASRGVRVFRGYAGWGPGQLEGEIEAGAWLVLDSEPGDVFSDDPDELWRTVLRRQPGRLAWLADAPDDLARTDPSDLGRSLPAPTMVRTLER